jgi:endonuclease III
MAARKAPRLAPAKPKAIGKRTKPSPQPTARRPARERAPDIFARLAATYPDARCSLDFETPFQLLVATILSAQCTDKRVNMVTPKLFATYPTPAALASAKREDVEELVKTTGFFRNKAKSLLGVSAAIESRHGGQVPSTLDELVVLPGVGRKTANVILGNAFDRNEGVVVDTHVARVTKRLGLTKHDDPVKIEQDLVKLFPPEQWTLLAHLLIYHGRQICEARLPKCSSCPIADLCPSFGIGL